jgi:hypothetical protein
VRRAGHFFLISVHARLAATIYFKDSRRIEELSSLFFVVDILGDFLHRGVIFLSKFTYRIYGRPLSSLLIANPPRASGWIRIEALYFAAGRRASH